MVADRSDHPAYGTAHPDTAAYPDHDLVFISPVEDAERTNLFRYYYAADRANQDLYNFEFTDADIGGVKFDAVQRSYVTRRSAFTPDTPAMGASMPNSPTGMFGTGAGSPSVIAAYVLAERKQTFAQEKELNSLYVFEVRTYIKRTAIKELGVDPLNGKMLTSTTNLYYATEVVSGGLTAAALFAAPTNSYWGLQTDGTQRSGKQLSADWYLVEQNQVITGTTSGGIVYVQSYSTNDRYYWPPVLDVYELMDWDRLDDGVDIYPALRFSPEGYDGPCLTTVSRTWRSTPFDYNATRSATNISVVDQMQPTRIYYACPYYTANIPECLHGEVLMQCDTGNTDPVYDENVNSARRFGATNYTTWPESIVAYDDQEPFRGGYLRTQKTIYRPAVPASVIWNPVDDPT